MPEATLVKPDRDFARRIMALGGESLKKCYQCATCSVVCERSPSEHPFPRKEMIWAQWGLKGRLAGDPDIWLCYRCGDCSERCPRGAKPADVMAALRDSAIEHYATPAFLGRAVAKAGLLPVLLAVPAVLIGLIVLATHRELSATEVDFSHFFPHWALQGFFGLFAGLATVVVVVGVLRFWKDLNRRLPPDARTNGLGGSISGAVTDVLGHGKFRDCTQTRRRYFSHLLTFWGFAGLFVTTVGVVFSAYILDDYPLGLFHPLKILGNLSTVALLAGVIWIIYERLYGQEATERSTSKDWTFIGILLTVVITGVATETLRFVNIPAAAYPVYFIHLVVVFALLIYLPYSRFAHMVYRTVALVHARYSGRE